MRKSFNCFVLLTVAFIVSCCKKYPENNLWFKNPEKLLPFFDTHLTKYQVNGIDSLDLLNNYFGRTRGLVKDIRTMSFMTARYYKRQNHYLLFGSSLTLSFTYEFTSKKKKIRFDSISDSSIFKKNIFIGKNIEWEIVRLARKGPFKIKTQLENGNLYEIDIE